MHRALALAVLVVLAACGSDGPDVASTNSATSTDPALHDELLEMLVFEAHGWPGWTLVGKDGSTAAWAIVQHADLDLAFQERGLALLTAAVAADAASKGDLAYLTDRVLVAKGEEQEYGTQWGSDSEGEPEPRTPIRDAANVDGRRAEAGLSTLAEYMNELEAAFEAPPTSS
jgi:uncharacterized protein DUF6624